MSVTVHNRYRGRPFRAGSPEAAAADRDRRRQEYADLRSRLRMSQADLAALVGLSLSTVKTMPCWTSPTTAPTEATIITMRAELVRRTSAKADDACAELLRRTRERIAELQEWREIELATIERELEEHMALCRAAEPEGLDLETEDAA